MQNTTKRLLIWSGFVAFLLFIPATMMLGNVPGWNWTASDFVLMAVVLFGIGVAYELIARRCLNTLYRIAFAIGLLAAFLLFWVNGAVGIIGDSDVNALYGAVFVVGLVGSLIARFRPAGMARTLFAAAIVQLLVPVIALIIGTSDFRPGVVPVFMLNAVFAMLFVVSGLLFHRAAAGKELAVGAQGIPNH